MRRCHVPGCSNDETTTKLHTFPCRNDKLFAIWAHRVANLELDSLEIKTATNRFVCDDHFAPICKGSLYNRSTLKVDALPTLKLPGYNGNPYSKNNCLIDRDTFNSGHSLRAPHNRGKLWRHFRKIGASLNNNGSAITLEAAPSDKPQGSDNVVNENYPITEGDEKFENKQLESTILETSENGSEDCDFWDRENLHLLQQIADFCINYPDKKKVNKIFSGIVANIEQTIQSEKLSQK